MDSPVPWLVRRANWSSRWRSGPIPLLGKVRGRRGSASRKPGGRGKQEWPDMGFLNGRVTYVRYRVGGDSPLPLGDEILELARQHLIGRHGSGEPTDGISVGWAGGDHVLDTTIEAEKNIVNDALHLAFRVDTDKIPGSLLRAYTKIETDARAKMNPSGFANKAQKQKPRRRPRPAPSPKPPMVGFAGWLTTRSCGTASRTSSTPGRPACRSSTACKPASARRSTGSSNRSAPGAWPTRWPTPAARSR